MLPGIGRKPQGFTWEDPERTTRRSGKSFPNRSIGVPFLLPAFPYAHSELPNVKHPKFIGVNLANWQTDKLGMRFCPDPILLCVG